MRTVLSMLPALLLVAGDQGEISLVSRDFEQLTGHGPEAGWEALFPVPEQRSRLQQGLDTRTVVALRQGDSRIIDWHCRPGPLPGFPCRFVATGTDVSAVAAAEERYRTMVQSNPFPTIVHRDGVIEFLNPAAVRMLGGVTSEQIVGQRVERFLVPEERERVLKAIENVGEAAQEDTILLAPLTGPRRPYEVHRCAVTLAGKPAVQSVFRDLTREQEQAHRRDQAESAVRREALTLLAGGVAHELNNGLAPLLGHTELLLHEFGEQDARAEQLQEMHDAALKLRQLADTILLLGDGRDLELRPTTLNTIVSDSLLSIEECLTDGVSLTLELDPEPWTCPLDATSIAQALCCLVLNAVQAMPDGGELKLITRKVYVDAAGSPAGLGPGEYAVLECADEGLGMDETTRRRAFDPFFTTREFGHAAGIGLSLVHAVVRRHGGQALLETQRGKGTRVILYFPCLPKTEPLKPAAPRRPLRLSRPASILLVEDDPAVLRLVRRLLEKEGYRVTTAASGTEALEVAAGSEPADLLLTDVVMPGLRGPQLYRQLVERWPHLRVVYMSGYAPDEITNGERFDYLRKPFTARELKDYLDRAFSS